MTTVAQFAADLTQRCLDAEAALSAVTVTSERDGYRLAGKAEGVELVRGYIDELLRISGGAV